MDRPAGRRRWRG